MKKKLLIFVCLFLSLTAVFADDGQWWQGKAITDFEYAGLVNVSEKTLDSLLGSYLGEPFTDELFSEIYTTLYSQKYVEYVSAEAIKGGESKTDLVVRFTIMENPMISSVSIEGNDAFSSNSLITKQNYEKGDFVNSNDLEANASLIEDYYREKGYKDVIVSAEASLDEKTNTESILYRISEGKQFKVRSILFEGIEAFNAKELKKMLATSEKSFFNSGNFIEANLLKDKAALLAHYHNNGYIDAAIVDVKVENVTEADDKAEYVNITFVISEGAQWRFGKITFTGNEVYSDEQIAAVLSVEENSVHNSEIFQNKFMNLASMYYDNGYIFSQIIPRPTKHEDTNTIDYAITIVEGPQAVIEEIRIEGLTKTKPHVFERELTVHVGEVFNRDAFIKSQQNIYNTGIIKSIRADLLQGNTENGVILLIEIEEGNQVELQFGATFGGTIDGFPISGFLQWSDKNVLGTGRDLAINTTLSPDTQSASISLSDDWVGNRRWGNSISFSAERSVRKNQLQRGIGSDYYDGRDSEKKTYPLGFANAEDYRNAGVTTPGARYLMDYDYYRLSLAYSTGYTWNFLPGNLSLSGGLSIGLNRAVYDHDKYDPYEALIYLYGKDWQFSNRLSFNLTWDGRDLHTNTTKGYMLSLGYTYAGGFLGGLSNYNKLSASAAWYHSIFSHSDDEGRSKHLVLSLNTSASFMFDQYWKKPGADSWDWYEAAQGATQYEMLYIDGMNIGRGFSPKTDKSFLWHNQIELSYPLVLDVLNVELFGSATGVADKISDLSSISNVDWYFALGAGIRMRIPGFPLGLYLVKNAYIVDNVAAWDTGYIFGTGKTDDGRGLKLVLAITTSIY